MKRIFWLLCLAVLPLCLASAAEFERGSIRLVLNENTGRFLMYSRGEDSNFGPLFFDNDPRTSFLSVLVNDRAFKLGDSSAFKIKLVQNADRPSFIFESSQLLVTEEFSFIKTPGSISENGVEITVTVESKSLVNINVGFRLLLDTTLGEPGAGPHFYLDSRTVNNEITVSGEGSGTVWVSRNNAFSLMGSIAHPDGEGPDSVYFANWKRLTDVTWKLPAETGRNFNAPPYSIGDSAVCYYVEPRAFGRGDRIVTRILLSTEDRAGFVAEAAPEIAAPIIEPPAMVTEIPVTPAPPVVEDQRTADLATINAMLQRMAAYVEAGTVTDEELRAMEQTIVRLRLKYGIGPGMYR